MYDLALTSLQPHEKLLLFGKAAFMNNNVVIFAGLGK